MALACSCAYWSLHIWHSREKECDDHRLRVVTGQCRVFAGLRSMLTSNPPPPTTHHHPHTPTHTTTTTSPSLCTMPQVLVFVNSADCGMRVRLFLEAFGVPAAVLSAELLLNSRHHILQARGQLVVAVGCWVMAR